MATATEQQAREHHAQQAAIAAGAGLAVRRLLIAGAGWPQILTTIASAQLRAAALGIATSATRSERPALVAPTPFAGVSALGFPIAEPVVAAIDARVPAPVEPLPTPWWGADEAVRFAGAVEQLVASEISDAGRSAAQAESYAQGRAHYVRILVPPTCKRCVVLAGRIYRTSVPFDRHPGCDCTNEQVDSLQQALGRGLVVTPETAYARGWVRDLTAAERKAIDDGSDLAKIVNSGSGVSTASIAGRRVTTTKYGTTRRAQWRRQNPSLLVRLRPESIYRIAGDNRAEALRLLKLYGYLT